MAARTQPLLLTALMLCSTLFLGGCSGLFFFPDQVTYVTPDRLNLEYEDVWLDTRDGERLHAWLLPGKPPVKGTVYFLHGNAQNISAHILNVAWLPAEGYNVFLPDYRGYGRSSGKPDLAGALHDVEIGMRWLAEHHAEEPIILLGQSLGGGLAIALASEWTQRQEQPEFHRVIVDGTFAGFRAIAREKLGEFWLTWAFQIPLSWTIPNDYEGIDHIANISPVPIMVIHSTRDPIIPYHHGVKLATAARDPRQFLTTDTPHAATFVLPAYRQAVLEFIEREQEGK
ncbi:MAG: alpha/beta hydrolase [Marinobacter sp.]|nr:alpha/beta hydrolase [Marinobacter sp.]